MQRRLVLHITLAAGVLAAFGGTARAQQEWVEAEVRRVDREGARVTLKHAEIKALDMPAMTMVFRVRDKAMLDGIEVGQRVRVQVVREGGQFVVAALQRAS